MKSITSKSIASITGISTTTVGRILDDNINPRPLNYLPTNLCFDEFRSTHPQMAFICIDADTHKRVTVLGDRLSDTIKKFFEENYSIDERAKVKHICMDMNAAYQNFVHELFPNAEIVIDRFHIIQLLGRAMDQMRVQALRQIKDKHSRVGSGANFAWQLHSSILSDKKRGIVRMNYFKGRHFQQDIIIVAVGYYFRFSLSYRDIVELLRDRGVSVHHTTVMRWVHHYGPIFKALWRQHQTSHTKSWRIDETYINVKGHWTYLYRAIDSNGLTLDFELRKHRDYVAAYHFLKRLLTTNGRPDRLVTDQYRATLKAVKHLMKQDYLSKSAHQCSKYRNNLIEQDHRFIKRHRVRSANFQNIRTASATLSGIEVIHALRKKTRRELSLIGFSAVDELKAMVPA